MRLINTETYKLEFFLDEQIPKYAILSHTWGKEEVSFQDMPNVKKIRNWKGYVKILAACDLARSNKFKYIWIDTCCINKESSAELSESINSMFQWYHRAQICYAYLVDVATRDANLEVRQSAFCNSRWFTRGWTLQELIAPRILKFYGEDWSELGTKVGLADTISWITSIPKKVLLHDVRSFDPDLPCVAAKMSWASNRRTTKKEDKAYCLMGLFGVNMPLLYGEGGEKAFKRLQEEIMKVSDDDSIFAWEAESSYQTGMLAGFPSYFANSGGLIRHPGLTTLQGLTSQGLRIKLPVIPEARVPPHLRLPTNDSSSLGVLSCGWPKGNSFQSVCIGLVRPPKGDVYHRYHVPLREDHGFNIFELPKSTYRSITIDDSLKVDNLFDDHLAYAMLQIQVQADKGKIVSSYSGWNPLPGLGLGWELTDAEIKSTYSLIGVRFPSLRVEFSVIIQYHSHTCSFRCHIVDRLLTKGEFDNMCGEPLPYTDFSRQHVDSRYDGIVTTRLEEVTDEVERHMVYIQAVPRVIE
jgi:Heterokaryon incompatibility protein (HET)